MQVLLDNEVFLPSHIEWCLKSNNIHFRLLRKLSGKGSAKRWKIWPRGLKLEGDNGDLLYRFSFNMGDKGWCRRDTRNSYARYKRKYGIVTKREIWWIFGRSGQKSAKTVNETHCWEWEAKPVLQYLANYAMNLCIEFDIICRTDAQNNKLDLA